MSAYTTLTITKSKAKAYVLENMISRLDDESFLEQQLDVLLSDRLYNAVICEDGDDQNDDSIL